MKNIDLVNGNDDWKALDIPKFSTTKECREWCATQPGANGYIYVTTNKKCFPKTGDVKMHVFSPSNTYGGVLPCP